MSASCVQESAPPIFRAVSSSARQLFQLINCIRFAPKVQVHITREGIQFAVEDSRIMQGTAFIDKALFTTFSYDPPASPSADPEYQFDLPSFQISLPALLETLQIFGASDNMLRYSKSDADSYSSNIRPNRTNAFSNQTLGMSGVCRMSYAGIGEPFSIVMEESGVTTTCNLNTYEPESSEEIPFNKQELEVKIIMQSRFLFDAISEISVMINSSPTSSTRLNIAASPMAPFLSLSATGPLGSASVEFAKSRDLLETFTVARKWTQSYKFEMIKAAAEAMRLASKVSFRGDRQGVLSLQFMVEVEGGGISFVDFRFVPFLQDEDDSGAEEDGEEEEDISRDEEEDDEM